MPTIRTPFLALLLACSTLPLTLGCRITGTPDGLQTPDPHGRYTELVEELSHYIEWELADKEIPGLSIALVEGEQVIWASGFGLADPETGVPATAETVYRVGSVSKLFTDIGIMQLVERGELDLDRPVQDYLPEFQPRNPFGGDITLRQLMSHRSGLVREPPVGHYFDSSAPSLAATVASLNETALVYAPETRIKYSNAAIAVVGYVLERLSGRHFAEYLEEAVLEPIGMELSTFAPSAETERRLAKAVMWSYDGRAFRAPTFELGMAPAGSMYSTVHELCDFMRMLFRGGEGAQGHVLQPASLSEMFRPQFAAAEAESGFGLGFSLGRLDGRRTYGHGGAIYGFATSLKLLPESELGVVVIANMDVVNSVTGRIADHALRLLLAERAGESLPAPPLSAALSSERRAELAGHYALDGSPLEFLQRGSELFLAGDRIYARVRARGAGLCLDDRLHFGPDLQVIEGGALRVGTRELLPIEAARPAPPPAHFEGLIGEYGWDHNVLFVFERGGRLHALIEWTEFDPLTEVSQSEFRFPEQGLYHGESIHFERDAAGRAHTARVAGIAFPRRALQGESVATFSIVPVRPVEELRRVALGASPPDEQRPEGGFHATDLVEITTLEPGIRLDIRYASTNNFMQARFYDEPRAFLQRPAAEALVRVHRALRAQGYGLLIHDAYRPWYVTKMFWDATPADKKIFVADPRAGSRHNRGCAVDLTLFDLKSGEPIEMLGLYDEMSPRSYPEYQGGSSLQRWHRELLRRAMEAEGFSVYEYEWWHFDYQGWERYRIGNSVFSRL